MSSSVPSVLVTGGAGFIGSHTTLELAPDWRPVVFDNLSRGHRSLVPASVPFVEGDIHDTDRLTAVMVEHRVQAVLHFAGYAYVGESMAEPGIYFDNNVTGTLHLLEAMRLAGVRRIVFSSSCAVYGQPLTDLINEEHPVAPINPYGQSKLMVEQILRWYEEVHEFRYCVLRYFNAAGCDLGGRSAEWHAPEPHVIPRLLQTATGQRSSFAILGDQHATADGTCIRDYIHVTDLARAHVLALRWLDSTGAAPIFNLGTGRGYSVRQLVDTAQAVTGRPIAAVVEPPRPGDPPRLVADASRARVVLGWIPEHSDLTTILQTAWRSLQGHAASAR